MKVIDFIQKKIFLKKDKKEDTFVEEENKESKNGWLDKFKDIFIDSNKDICDEDLDKLEETLIAGDVGIDTTCEIITRIEKKMQQQKIKASELKKVMNDIISGMMDVKDKEIKTETTPHVIMVIGVNGVGKTTTIGKLANMYKKEGKSIIIGAADTFRAGAVSQLQTWCDNADVHMINGATNKQNPSTVAFNTVQYAIENKMDVAIIDTAGRLHNKIGLMEELSKMKRVIKNLDSNAPQEVLLVLDASTGQNVFNQLEVFVKMIEVTGMIITKMDGIAKSGFIIGAINKFHIPVKFVGTGEKIDDLYYFDSKNFISNIL